VAALLAIARKSKGSAVVEGVSTRDANEDEWIDVRQVTSVTKDLDKLVLWVEIKKQIAILREGLESE
jgi:hypothetical protein